MKGDIAAICRRLFGLSTPKKVEVELVTHLAFAIDIHTFCDCHPYFWPGLSNISIRHNSPVFTHSTVELQIMITAML